MALVNKARAQEILRRYVTFDGGGFPRISADVQDLLETVEKLTMALEETLASWEEMTQGDDGRGWNYVLRNPIYQRNQCLLEALNSAVPVESCPVCGHVISKDDACLR